MAPRIKIKYNIRSASVDFLDVVIYKDMHCQDEHVPLLFRTHQKQQNAYLYIPRHSLHPASNFKGWVQGELIRYCITCSQEQDFAHMKAVFFDRLAARGYSRSFLEAASMPIRFSKRQLYLQDKPSHTHDARRTVFLTLRFTRHAQQVCLQNVVKTTIAQHGMEQVFDVMLGYKRAPNLGNYIVRAQQCTTH